MTHKNKKNDEIPQFIASIIIKPLNTDTMMWNKKNIKFKPSSVHI